MSDEVKLYSAIFVYLLIVILIFSLGGIGFLLVDVAFAAIPWIIIVRIAKPGRLISFSIFAALSFGIYLLMLLGSTHPK